MANYTEHYQLHQWEPSDNFLRTDFNQDFARIDTGIRAAKAQAERLEREKAEISTGAYTGDNAASRTIHLGFRPRAVLGGDGAWQPLWKQRRRKHQRRPGGRRLASVLSGHQRTMHARHPDPGQAASPLPRTAGNRSYMNYSGTKYHYFAVK